MPRHVTTHQFSAGQSRLHLTWRGRSRIKHVFLQLRKQIVKWCVLSFCWHFTLRQQAGRRNVSASEELDFWRTMETEKGAFFGTVEVLKSLKTAEMCFEHLLFCLACFCTTRPVKCLYWLLIYSAHLFRQVLYSSVPQV